MRIGDLARQAGVTPKAVRYYEDLGLLQPRRLANGYREYDDGHLRIVAEIRQLAALGIPAARTGPFIECMALGHEHGDDCVSSLTEYRDSIAEIDRIVASLQERRTRLVARLDRSASRSFTTARATAAPMIDYTILPDNLPVPEDDGAAAHLRGMAMPQLVLPVSDGTTVDLAGLGPGRTVLYLYPLSGRPAVDLPDGWDAIPGARGCSTEACDFRDHFADLQRVGVSRVFGLSSQDPDYQAELVSRLRLPFAMVSDQLFQLRDALQLPTFAAPGHEHLYRRLTLVIRENRIEHVFYPVFPPNTHAQQVLDWFTQQAA